MSLPEQQSGTDATAESHENPTSQPQATESADREAVASIVESPFTAVDASDEAEAVGAAAGAESADDDGTATAAVPSPAVQMSSTPEEASEAPAQAAEDVSPTPPAAPVPQKTRPTGGSSSKGRTSARSTAHHRSSVRGRQTIAEANAAGLTEAMHPGWSQGTFAGMSTGIHLNGEQLTTAEEHHRFRQRNKVRSTFRGPVYVAEDLHVPCQACGGPVDPVRRVPVGSLFFHPGCVRCYLCGLTGVTEPFQQVGSHRVICSFCASKGHAPCVQHEEAIARGVVLGAIRGDRDKLLLACEQEERVAMQPQSVNQATIRGAVAPSLAIGPVHTPRNTTSRSFALIQRQQYYTQNDRNLLAIPSIAVKTIASAREAPCEDASELAALRARRRSGSTLGPGYVPKLTYH